MVDEFVDANGRGVGQADREEVMPDDINSVTVSQDGWEELFTIASTNTKRYAPGYGFGNRNSSQAGFADFTLMDDSSTPVNVDGNYRWVLYESSDHDVPMRIGSSFSSSAMRASESESLRDKQIQESQLPRGSQDRELVLEFKASSDSDGATVSPANSTAEQGLPYSRYRV